MIFRNLFIKTVVSLGDKILGANYLSSLHMWNKYDTFSESKLEEIQDENLKKFSIIRLPMFPIIKITF
ncbi:hypothetical protein H9X57_10835 [Flavobacterium piscinae]|uniref:hypothetical protein n=1 Tax=Flavobacterium piscinae TaxID=2506424 RepID=UPI00198621DA|nr:hypothetical protein [Flavobacterium piscinae]MBC8883683.1 hypothetical protein [Flavobacterium piscinae]